MPCLLCFSIQNNILDQRHLKEAPVDAAASAVAFATNVLKQCTRTVAGGDTFDAVHYVFGGQPGLRLLPLYTYASILLLLSLTRMGLHIIGTAIFSPPVL